MATTSQTKRAMMDKFQKKTGQVTSGPSKDAVESFEDYWFQAMTKSFFESFVRENGFALTLVTRNETDIRLLTFDDQKHTPADFESTAQTLIDHTQAADAFFFTLGTATNGAEVFIGARLGRKTDFIAIEYSDTGDMRSVKRVAINPKSLPLKLTFRKSAKSDASRAAAVEQYLEGYGVKKIPFKTLFSEVNRTPEH